MAETVVGALKLDGDLRHRRPVESAAVAEDVVDHLLANEQRQELVDDHPLVVPGGKLARATEHLVRRLEPVVPRHAIHGLVVER